MRARATAASSRSPPPPELAPSCAEGGVLGVLPGIIGSLQANETLKLALGIGDSLAGRLLLFDALAAEFSGGEAAQGSELPGVRRAPYPLIVSSPFSQ